MFSGARRRLTIWYAAVFFGVLVVLGVAGAIALTRSLDRQVESGIESVVTGAVARGLPRQTPPAPPPGGFQGETADVFLALVRADGSLIANYDDVPMESLLEGDLVDEALAGNSVWRTLTVEGERLRVFAEPISVDGQVVGAAIGGRSLAARDATLRDFVVVLAGVSALGLALAVAGGYLLAGRALRPIAAAYDRQRTFVSDASHELRAPITVIRASSDLLLREEPMTEVQRESIKEIRDVADEAGVLIEQLLDLARLQGPAQDPVHIQADLADVVGTELERMRPLLDAHGTAATAQLERAPARIAETEARRIIRALLENVIAHTPHGSSVRVSTSSSPRAARLIVEDDGPGVQEDFQHEVFERFVRANLARSPGTGAGAGLGLAIVREIAVRAGGSTSASTSEQGGLRIEVTLPAQREARATRAPAPHVGDHAPLP